MMDASVAPSGQNGMKASKVKAQFADLSKQVPDAEVLAKGKRQPRITVDSVSLSYPSDPMCTPPCRSERLPTYRSSVVLPAPAGPTIATISPDRTKSDSPSSTGACAPLHRYVMLSRKRYIKIHPGCGVDTEPSGNANDRVSVLPPDTSSIDPVGATAVVQ